MKKEEIKNDTINNVVSNNEQKVISSDTSTSITNDAAAIKKKIAKENKEKREKEIISFLNNNNDINIKFISKEGENKKETVKKLNQNKRDVKNAMKKEFISFEGCKENTLHLLNTLQQRGEIDLLISLKQIKFLFNNKDFKGLCIPTKTGKYTSNIMIDTLFSVYKIKIIN